MNLNERTSEKMLFSRFKYFNGMPFTVEDRHQETDIQLFKEKQVLDKLFKNGPISPILYSTRVPPYDDITNPVRMDIHLNDIYVYLNGDIFIISNGDVDGYNSHPYGVSLLENKYLVAVCWLEEVTATSTLHEYGGINNLPIDNNLIDETLGVQVSTRYQIKWCLSTASINTGRHLPRTPVTIDELLPNDTDLLEDVSLMCGKTDSFYTHEAVEGLPSADGMMYVLPLLKITDGVITAVQNDVTILNYIVSATEPDVCTYKTVWYNYKTSEFKIGYTNNWVSLNTSATYTKKPDYVFTEDIELQESITIPLPFTLIISQKLKVLYSGVELLEGVDYTINRTTNELVLKDFSVVSSDVINFLTY